MAKFRSDSVSERTLALTWSVIQRVEKSKNHVPEEKDERVEHLIIETSLGKVENPSNNTEC